MVVRKTDKKTIGISSLITLGMILAVLITPTFFDNTQYYCEVESSILECPGGLSGGAGTRCYFTEEKNSWDYCSSGWMEITDDILIQEEPEVEPESKLNGEIPAPAPGIRWLCSPKGCIRIE